MMNVVWIMWNGVRMVNFWLCQLLKAICMFIYQNFPYLDLLVTQGTPNLFMFRRDDAMINLFLSQSGLFDKFVRGDSHWSFGIWKQSINDHFC